MFAPRCLAQSADTGNTCCRDSGADIVMRDQVSGLPPRVIPESVGPAAGAAAWNLQAGILADHATFRSQRRFPHCLHGHSDRFGAGGES